MKKLYKSLGYFLARSSKLPAQPTQNNISGLLPSVIHSANVETFIIAIWISRVARHRKPLWSRLFLLGW